MSNKPSIGRIAHFYGYDTSEPVPAIISRVHANGHVNLRCFNDDPFPASHELNVEFNDGSLAMSDFNRYWVWPPRVE